MNKTLWITRGGELRRRDNTLCITFTDGEKRFLPAESIDEIHIIGETDVNKKLLEFLSTKQILLHIYSHYGKYMGTYYPKENNNSGASLLAQAKHCLDPALRIAVASSFVIGAAKNMKRTAAYYGRRAKAETKDIEEALDDCIAEAADARAIDELMGLEGSTRKTYFKLFDRVIKDENFAFVRRTRKPPANRMNALISYLNSLCYNFVLSQIYKTHLDPRIGFLHESNDRSFSFNLDVSEIFKPLLVDRLIFSLVNKRALAAKHFEKRGSGVSLNEEGRGIVIRAWDERLSETVKIARLGRPASYGELVLMELYKLERHFKDQETYEPYVSRW
ncbi:MAG: type I-B CRISPR-associated endonuclease Cas1 [Synergistes sp.]|nr:type I-B CRISPR-associated endonuclease Cas1 [Synergistes sp.]